MGSDVLLSWVAMTEQDDEGMGSLDVKVKSWLGEQGYPTEFRTASICRGHGFRVWQGFHVRSDQSSAPREIDVVASADHRSGNHLVRVEHVFECKWSKDKPWIVFTSSSSQMAASACASQTIGNLLGSAAIWTIAGQDELASLDFFLTPERPGFGGRQAFSKGQDQFYSAIAAVSDLAFLLVNRGRKMLRPYQVMPVDAFLAFPVVVVEGALYEAYFDSNLNDIQLERRKRIRCHWRGAASWDYLTTVDVVALDHLDEFMEVRARECETLLTRLNDAVCNIEKCFEKRTLQPLKIAPGPRGTVGLPPLLVDLRMLDDVKRSRRKLKPSVKKTKRP